MMWRILIIMTLVLLSLLIPVSAFVRFGGGGGFSYSTYSTTFTFGSSSSTSTTTQVVTDPGSNWNSLAWLDPCVVSVVNTNQLEVLPDQADMNNNASVSLSASVTGLNTTIDVPSGTTGNYGGFAIGYGVLYPSTFLGNYGPASPYGSYGIVVVLERGAMADYHIFLYYNGVVWGNWSVGSFNTGQDVMLGFVFNPPNTVNVYWFNGTLHVYKVSPVYQTSTGFKEESLATVTSTYTVDVDTAVNYYGEWVIVNYQYITTTTTTTSTSGYSTTISWTAVTLGNGVKALYGFTGAGNPVNVTTNATSWSVVKIVNVQNFSVTGSQYPVSGSVSYSTSPRGIYLLANVYPSGNLNGWYMNVTIEFQFVTPSQTIDKNVTVPVFVSMFAVSVYVNPPQSSYMSGQAISVTNSTAVDYPSDLGYITVAQPKALVDIQGLTQGYVPLPYSTTVQVTAVTQYLYVISVTEDGYQIGAKTGTITVYPTSETPVIFLTQYPTTATLGTRLTLTFQFSLNTPVSNTTSPFIQRTSTFEWTYTQIVSSSSLVEFQAYYSSPNDGFLIITESSNYLIPFNGSTGLTFTNNSITSLEFQVNGLGQLVLTNGQGQVLTIANSTPVIGLGLYYGAGPLTLKWFFADGIILQSATADQAYTILTGTSLNTLTQYTSGYTNGTGFGQVTVPLTDTPYELVEIYWSGLGKYAILNISVTQPTTTTTTTINTSTINYNYTQPFRSNISPTSTLYNFSGAQPWATLVGIVVTVIVTLLGWKFGGKSGASGGAVMGLIAVSYLGLMPWYIFYIFVFGIAMLIAKIFVDRFMGSEE